MEELQQLLAAMGCSTPAEALAQVARTNTSLASIQAATGLQSASDALSKAIDAAGFAKAVEGALGVSGHAALAKLEGLKLAQSRVAELEAEAAAMARASDDRAACASIDEATADGRIAPADRAKAEGIYAKYGIAGLGEYLDLLPRAAKGRPSQEQVRQPPVAAHGAQSSGPGSSVDSEVRKRLQAKGFSDAEIEAAAKLPTIRASEED